MKFLKDHPTFGGAALSLLGAVLGIFIHNPELVASLVGIAALFVGLHQVVTPVTTAAAKITDAATQAATQVAADLDQTIAGGIGEVTDAGQSIVNNAIDKTIGNILGGK